MKNLLIIFSLGLILNSCSSGMDVVSDYDKSADFSSYKTFQLLPWDDDLQELMSMTAQSAIDEAIKNEMILKGYTYVEQGADLVVSTYVHLDEKTGVTAYNNYYGTGGYGYYGGFGYGYGYGYGGGGVGYATTTYQEYSIMVGSLIIDFYDQAERKLVWQGIGTDELSDKRAKNQKKLPSYVRQVLYDFPKKK